MSVLAELDGIGRDARGGVTRLAWSAADLELREWFTARASRIGLEVETDGAGNLWGWWDAGSGSALAVGSHLDSVRRGGVWDGPLGVVGALRAVESLRSSGFVPSRPIGVVAFSDEEGARFGVACLGSRLLTGRIDPDAALALRDEDGITLAEAMTAAGHDPRRASEPDLPHPLGAAVELHIEQGRMPVSGGVRGLGGAGSALGVATGIWPHGRWRLDLEGVADHAGTTALQDRVDPVLPLAEAVLEVRRAAEELGVLGTVGRVRVDPGSVNAIASSASLWIDARGADPDAVHRLVERVERRIGVSAVSESWTAVTPFDAALTEEVADSASVTGAPLPRIPSGAGHDAGVLAASGIPSAMLLVRNPTGVSHSPEERVDEADAAAGIAALTEAIRRLAT